MRSIASIAVDRCGCRRLKLPRKTDHINPSVISVRNAPFIMSSQNTARNRGTGCPKSDLKKSILYWWYRFSRKFGFEVTINLHIFQSNISWICIASYKKVGLRQSIWPLVSNGSNSPSLSSLNRHHIYMTEINGENHCDCYYLIV